MMKSIYISIPISGYDLEERKEAARKAKESLAARYPDADILTPFDVCPEPGRDYAYYMGRDVEALLKCDAVYMCAGWVGSKGCTAEQDIATIYGKTVIYEDEASRQIVCRSRITVQPADNGGFMLSSKSSTFAFTTTEEAVDKIGKDMISMARMSKNTTVFDMTIYRNDIK